MKKQLKVNAYVSAFFILVVFAGLFGGTLFVGAQTNYVPLSPLPGASTQEISAGNVGSYLQTLFTIAISIAGVLAVLMIVIGGLEYLLSEAFTSKADAITRIQAALWGLIIILASVVILNTINPDLLNINLTLPGMSGKVAQRVLSDQDVIAKDGGPLVVHNILDELLAQKQLNKKIIGTKQTTEGKRTFERRCRLLGGTVHDNTAVFGGGTMFCAK